MTLSRIERKTKGICTYPGCSEPAGDTCECDRHAEGTRARQEALRARRAEDGLCTRCPRVRRKGSTWGCAKCHPVVTKIVTKSDRLAANTSARTTASNLGRTHYHGQNKRGPMSRVAANRSDLEAAAKEVASALGENDYAYSPEVDALPRIQRLGERQRVAGRAYYAARLLLQVAAREGADLTGLVESLRDEDK